MELLDANSQLPPVGFVCHSFNTGITRSQHVTLVNTQNYPTQIYDRLQPLLFFQNISYQLYENVSNDI